MVDATHCDAVMIGRAAPSNPWIFRQIAQYTASKEAAGAGAYDIPTDADRYRMIRGYFKMLLEETESTAETTSPTGCPTSPGFGNLGSHETATKASTGRETAGKMKQFASWFTHGVPGGAKLRAAIYQAKTGAAVLAQVEGFFTTHHYDSLSDASDSVPQEYPDGALVCD